MSRTRIVKGKYTKISEKGHSMYTNESVFISALKGIFQKGDEKGISHNTPSSAPIADQPIKLLVHFRPHKEWKGEFGFDWLRQGDTRLFKDNKFSDIVAYQYLDSRHRNKVTSNDDGQNKYDGYFLKDEDMYNRLKREYNPFSIPWKKQVDRAGNEKMEEYFIPWMSIKKDAETKITFFADIVDQADYLEFPTSDYFTFTPNRIDIKGKSRIRLNDFDITIKCTQEFTTDQTIELKAYKSRENETIEALAGKLNVWANDVTKHKEKNVVFVEIKTKLPNMSRPKQPEIADEKVRINQYLGQAYIKLSDTSNIVSLDLVTDTDFMNYITNSKVDKEKVHNQKSLIHYLTDKLKDEYPDQYNRHFKAFYFAEDGYKSDGNNISGYSSGGSNYVVVFKSKNDQTAAHEFLHAMRLPHTFTNKEASADAQYTYTYAKTDNLLDYSHHPDNNNKRCSLYYWQWKQANNSVR